MAKEYKLTDTDINEIIMIAARAGIEAYRKEYDKAQKVVADRMDKTKNAKNILKSYRRMKLMLAEDIEINPAEKRELRYDFLTDLMGVTTPLFTRTEKAIMDYEYKRKKNCYTVSNVEKAFALYKEEVESGSEEEQRRCRILEKMYIGEENITIKEISLQEGISEKTAYRDLELATKIMSDFML